MAGVLYLVVRFGRVDLVAQAADFALRIGELLGRVVAGRAGLRLDRVELPAGDGELLDELLVLGAAFVELPAEGGELLVAGRIGWAALPWTTRCQTPRRAGVPVGSAPTRSGSGGGDDRRALVRARSRKRAASLLLLAIDRPENRAASWLRP